MNLLEFTSEDGFTDIDFCLKTDGSLKVRMYNVAEPPEIDLKPHQVRELIAFLEE